MNPDYFLRQIPYKDMMLLRDLRVQQLMKEREDIKHADEQRQHDDFVNRFMSQ